MKSRIFFLFHILWYKTIPYDIFTATIKYRFVPLMPKNTYGNSINAQHVAPRIEERNILVESTGCIFI